MTTFDAYYRRRSSQSALLAATAALALLAGSAASACPLGNHDSPRVRMLHALQKPNDHGSGHQMSLAQLQPQTSTVQPKRTELGTYSRDLPHGAAAPTSDAKPPLRDNLGTLSWSVTKDPSGEAQAYFNQGYRLGWGFNHAEAARAFRAAQELDPNCAMCLWGEAWVLGPHINYPMDADANARALTVLEKARGLAPASGDMQIALVEALSKRHSPDSNADRKALDQAYADAMEAVQARFPNDPHIAVLTADALMNLTPWDYWADGGRTPKGKTEKIVTLLEGVLGTAQSSPIEPKPDHPGAVHLYIHTVEASDHPERAAPHASRLESLMPGAGHLVHMPSHIWYRLGRWRESLDANVRAAAADEALVKEGGASLLYSEAYYAHNVHFLMVSALTGGDGSTAVEAAQKLSGIVSERAQREVPWTQPITAAPYNVHAVFSKPEDVLALPAPKGDFPYVKAAWHYARGVALARLGRADEARAEAGAIDALAKSPEIMALPDAGVPGPDVLSIAVHEIEARIAQNAGEHAQAATLFAEAATIQDGLPYMEPPYWYYPVHQSLGAALMAEGKPAEAAMAFREALRRSPNNGWAAAGLLRAAEAQGDQPTVEEAKSLMQKNWFGNGMPAPEQL
ncbi:tetratricopeptide (TPR) repeat protein [Microvirga lupini]|uniref:Tetratricopeptide (TPR) repeat protein n=1 Tax=Microvirga lupini TaxID=420324 RepID=A0A7W4VJ96_9HYPH|nr:tetratricopeptide repeat protein [Microvirga lupini]MBB3018206.1 tetratricopeptide (TPR) repeat protein [Microvirga lupini]